MSQRRDDDPYEDMAAWVWRDGNKHPREPAEDVAARLTMADLMMEHSKATIVLCGPIADNIRERWQEVLAVVCKEIGDRFDSLTRQTEEHLPRQIRSLWTAQEGDS